MCLTLHSKDRITVALRCHEEAPYGNVRLSLLQLRHYFIIFFRHLGFLLGLSLSRWVILSQICRLEYFSPTAYVLGLLMYEKIHIIIACIGAVLIQLVRVHPQRCGEGF